jgi:hypothetical protein
MQPTEYSLSDNFPNPFNPETTIIYTLPEAVHVTLDVFDISGRKVSTLVDSNESAGKYNILFNGVNLASGVYMYRLQAGSFISQKKMLLLK